MTKALSMMGHVNDLTVTWAGSVGGWQLSEFMFTIGDH